MRVSTNIFYEQSMRGIAQQRQQIIKLEGELSSGLRVSEPSDSPSAYAASQRLQSQNAALEQYSNSSSQLKNRLGLASQVIQEMMSVVSNIHSIGLQAASATTNNAERSALAKEVKQAKAQLLGLANTSTVGSGYLFAGSRASTAPFIKQADGSVVYRGDNAAGRTHVSTNTQVTGLVSGSAFNSVMTGNGYAVVHAADANTGDARAILTGVVNVGDATAFRSGTESLEVDFIHNPSGQLIYQIKKGGTVQSSGAYKKGMTLTVGGSSLRVSGTPKVGDSFEVSPSRPQSLFKIVDQLNAVLTARRDTPAQRAKQEQKIQGILADLGNSQTAFLSMQATIGVSMRAIGHAVDNNATQKNSNKQAVSRLRDADTPKVIVKLQQSQAALLSAMKAFSQVSGLSLFNYLR